MKKLTIALEDDVHHKFSCMCALTRKKMTQVIRQQIEKTIEDAKGLTIDFGEQR